MAKRSTIKELYGKSSGLVLPLTKKFDLMIERQFDDKYFYTIFTIGGDNKFDITPFVELNEDMTDKEVKDIILDYVMTKIVFGGELKPITPRDQIQQPNRLENYDFMKDIDERWINYYADTTGDGDFENLDPYVLEYINDIMTELKTSPYPYKARKKWDDYDKLLRIRNTIIKQVDEYLEKNNK